MGVTLRGFVLKLFFKGCLSARFLDSVTRLLPSVSRMATILVAPDFATGLP